MTREIAIAGEGFQFVLRIHGYERPHLLTGADANWLIGEAELNSSTTGRFSGRHDVSLRTEELTDFRDQLAQLVEQLDGEARLVHMEDQVGCRISLRRGVGEFDGFVREHVGAELRVTGLRTDQSYLQATLRDSEAVVREFPVKGDPLG